MELDENALDDSCALLAKAMLWDSADKSADIVETVKDRILALTPDHVAFINDMDRDPNIVVRAIDYITHTHGYPIGADVTRISIILDTLIELAVPNTEQTKSSVAFLPDVQTGLSDALAYGSE